jgi:hypothetical protein
MLRVGHHGSSRSAETILTSPIGRAALSYGSPPLQPRERHALHRNRILIANWK